MSDPSEQSKTVSSTTVGWYRMGIAAIAIALVMLIAMGHVAASFLVSISLCVGLYARFCFHKLDVSSERTRRRWRQAISISLAVCCCGFFFWSAIGSLSLGVMTSFFIEGKVALGSFASAIAALAILFVGLVLIATLLFKAANQLRWKAAFVMAVQQSLILGLASSSLVGLAFILLVAMPLFEEANFPTGIWNLGLFEYAPALLLTLLGGAVVLATVTLDREAISARSRAVVIISAGFAVIFGHFNVAYIAAMSATNMVGMIVGVFSFDDRVIAWYSKAHRSDMSAEDIAAYLNANAHWKTHEDPSLFLAKFPPARNLPDAKINPTNSSTFAE